MDSSNFNDALGVGWLNLAQHGRKSHLGRMIDDRYPLVIFPGSTESSVHLWDTINANSRHSLPLPFVIKDPFYIDERSAETIIGVFRELAPDHAFELHEGEPAEDRRTTIYIPDLTEGPSRSPADIALDEAGQPRLGYADPLEALKVAQECERHVPLKGLVLEAKVDGLFYDATGIDDLDAITDDLVGEGFVGATHEFDGVRQCIVFDAADISYTGHVSEEVVYARKNKTGYLGRFENTARVTAERPSMAPVGP